MKSTQKVLWIAILIIAALVVGDQVRKKTEATEVSDLINAKKSKVEETLGITLSSCPDMAENVFEYSKSGNVRVDGNREAGIGIVYIGAQCGFRIESDKYTLFDISVGKSRVGVGSKMTYDYEDFFEIDEGFEREMNSTRTDFPVFYYNRANNDCLVISCEKSTGNVVAVTYFNDFKKVTEQLKF